MNKIILIVLVLFTTLVDAKEYGLHFDDQGEIIRPDQEYLSRGLENEKDGFRNMALKDFIKSAEYGNYLAMSLVGLYKLQDKNYVESLAWYKLVDLSQIQNRAYIEKIISNLEQYLTPEEVKEALSLKSELAETYGTHPTLLRRERWKNSLEFTGTNLKGYIPPFLQIQLNSGMVVTGTDIKKQVEDFIYNYEFNLGYGDVTLDDVELVEGEEDSANENKK